LNPVWNSTFFFLASDECKSFRIDLYDKDVVGRDDSLGHCTILRKDRDERHLPYQDWFYLEHGKGGVVQVCIQELDLSSGLQSHVDEHKQDVTTELRSKSREQYTFLEVKIENAQGLKKADFFGSSDPYCVFDFSKDPEGNAVCPKTSRTRTIMNTLNPVWDEYFHFIIPSGLKMMKINIYDYDKASQDDLIGHVNIALDDDLGEMQRKELAVEKKGKLCLSYIKYPLKAFFRKHE
jgi:Ca2+-dependent lipid-binding protein